MNGLYWYIEQIYGAKQRTDIESAFSICVMAHRFNEVRDYIDGLTWDGVKRLDTLLIDYLGAEDTFYTRTVTRKMFVAGVARAMTPGVKFDNMLILVGSQGLGKSTLLRRMAHSWFNDSICSFEGKEAAELIQGVWLVEISELGAFNKSDTKRIKQFLSLESDYYCVSMRSEDYLELPELVYNDIPVQLDTAALKAYKRLERDMLLEVDDTTITAQSAAVLENKLLQLCNGAAYDTEGHVTEIHSCKIEALLETIEQLGDEHVIVCYNFKHDKDRILIALRKTNKRVAVYAGDTELQAWNMGKIEVLLVQPASCGYGLNLQAGGHHIIWFGLTWSLELYQQTNKRLHRQGQQHPVVVHRLIVTGGADEDVIKSLSLKDKSQESLLNFLRVRIKNTKSS